MPDPLDGVRIFDMTTAMNGPWAAMLLGSMGADVLHILQPDVDWSKLAGGPPPTINGTSSCYIAWNMNKRGVFIDLKDPEGKAFAHQLNRDLPRLHEQHARWCRRAPRPGI